MAKIDQATFCAVIFSHKRSADVSTYKLLRKRGYTGAIRLVVDDADPELDQYKEQFGDEVITFSKEAVYDPADEVDNFPERRSVLYARNAVHELVRAAGFRYFVQLDDDYYHFAFRFREDWQNNKTTTIIHDLDTVFALLLRFYASVPYLTTFAICQGGDFIGGGEGKVGKWKRKAMNFFLCDVDRPFKFLGKLNDDVNSSLLQRDGSRVFLSTTLFSLDQGNTQENAGGLTEIYKAFGTYVKSFYSVIVAPSAVKITLMGDNRKRLHHQVNWGAIAPKIISPAHRKSNHVPA
jgi:hypothetical protein